MATVVGTVLNAWDACPATGPGLNHTISSAEWEVLSCYVSVQWTSGTYAAADDASFNPKQVIEDHQRKGKPVTILQACFVQAGDENGAVIGAGACTVSANVVTHELLQEDLSTERADGAMSTNWPRPVVFRVSYRQLVE